MFLRISSCLGNARRLPFHLGSNRSPSWASMRSGKGLRPGHDHLHQVGGEDVITQCDSDTVSESTATPQEFPVDAEPISLFTYSEMQISTTHIRALEIDASRIAVELRGEDHWFRVWFDLGKPAAKSEPACGA